MVKKHSTVNVEEDLLERAKSEFINISEITEEAIKKRLNIKPVEIENSSKCSFCGRELEQANKNAMNGLMWLWPDEKWICPPCLKVEISRVTWAR